MKRTLRDKYEYNKKRRNQTGDKFSGGYCFGVKLYCDFTKADAEFKTATRRIFTAAGKNARDGDKWSKGVMCGIRDAANHRKSKQRK